ncbi:MAG TPA: GNAT family N-acetyltransferase [Cyclobacteriaceae bacterium]
MHGSKRDRERLFKEIYFDEIGLTKLGYMEYGVPTMIETNRLTLRMFRDEDWKDLHLYYSSEKCMKYTIGRPLTEGETWRTMAGMIGHWQLRGYGPYAIEEKETEIVLGITGLWFPNDWPEPEIKWGLAQHAWGKGFATEAAMAVKKMAFGNIQNCQLISLILMDNQPSIKVARTIGATFEKEIVFREKRCHIYRHSR